MYKHFVAFSAVCLFHKNRVSPSEIAYLVNDIRHSPLKYGLLKYTRTPLEQKYGMKWQMDCLHVIHILSQYQSEATTITYKCYKIRECTFLCTFSVLQFNSCVIIMFFFSISSGIFPVNLIITMKGVYTTLFTLEENHYEIVANK